MDPMDSVIEHEMDCFMSNVYFVFYVSMCSVSCRADLHFCGFPHAVRCSPPLSGPRAPTLVWAPGPFRGAAATVQKWESVC